MSEHVRTMVQLLNPLQYLCEQSPMYADIQIFTLQIVKLHLPETRSHTMLIEFL